MTTLDIYWMYHVSHAEAVPSVGCLGLALAWLSPGTMALVVGLLVNLEPYEHPPTGAGSLTGQLTSRQKSKPGDQNGTSREFLIND